MQGFMINLKIFLGWLCLTNAICYISKINSRCFSSNLQWSLLIQLLPYYMIIKNNDWFPLGYMCNTKSSFYNLYYELLVIPYLFHFFLSIGSWCVQNSWQWSIIVHATTFDLFFPQVVHVTDFRFNNPWHIPSWTLMESTWKPNKPIQKLKIV